jgi:ribonuclease BN (tRNA processing enzyme)
VPGAAQNQEGSMLELVILGSAGWMPQEGMMTTCLAVRAEEDLVLFDLGTGVARLRRGALRELLPSPEREIHVFFSHLHFDHLIGLTYVSGLWPNATVLHVPRAAGEVPGPEVIKTLFGGPFYTKTFDHLLPSISLEAVGPGEWVAPGMVVTAYAQDHPGGSLGYRVGDAFAFMTDTRDEPGAVGFVRGVKVLVHEAWSYKEVDPGVALASASGHTSAEQAAELAARAGVGELWLSHLPPNGEDYHREMLSRARAIFPPTFLCKDGMSRRLD